jgi:hypothetical protein
METFAKLFGSLLALVYHCFDRIVILGHLPLLTRPENIVHFFRDIHQVKTIDKEALRQRTKDYHSWVEAFAKRRKIPLEWAEKGVHPYLRRMERRKQFGVYFILKSMEIGPPRLRKLESQSRMAINSGQPTVGIRQGFRQALSTTRSFPAARCRPHLRHWQALAEYLSVRSTLGNPYTQRLSLTCDQTGSRSASRPQRMQSMIG